MADLFIYLFIEWTNEFKAVVNIYFVDRMYVITTALLFVVAVDVLAQSTPLYLNTCSGSVFQKWIQTSNGTKLYILPDAQLMCVDIAGFNTQPGATVQTFPCGRGSGLNEDFVISPSSIKSMQTPPTCLAAAEPLANGLQ